MSLEKAMRANQRPLCRIYFGQSGDRTRRMQQPANRHFRSIPDETKIREGFVFIGVWKFGRAGARGMAQVADQAKRHVGGDPANAPRSSSGTGASCMFGTTHCHYGASAA